MGSATDRMVTVTVGLVPWGRLPACDSFNGRLEAYPTIRSRIAQNHLEIELIDVLTSEDQDVTQQNVIASNGPSTE